MKHISVTAPVKKPEDIIEFANNSDCRDYYIYYNKFMDNNFSYLEEFVENGKKTGSKVFVNFKHGITEEELPEIKRFLKYISTTETYGIFINSYTVLEVLKSYKNLPFKVIADSYFEIHNLSGLDFINSFHRADGIIITEEIYPKNIQRMKKYAKIPLSIDAENLPWCASEIIKTKAIDNIIIKGKFNTSEEILEGIKLVEKILDNPKQYKNKPLPFKHVRKSRYMTNHFSGDMISALGEDFKFSTHIKKFKWDFEDTEVLDVPESILREICSKYRINLRLTELSHIKELEKYIDEIGFCPIYSVEYGEIVSTCDLSKKSFTDILKKVKGFCCKHGIKFQLSTPNILIERDFDRVYEYEKSLLLSDPKPDSIILNNIGYFWNFVNDPDVNETPFEIGQGISLSNSLAIKCLNNIKNIDTIDFTGFQDYNSALNTLKKIKNIIPNKKYTIGGNTRVSALGLCPLNNDSAIVSRLSCPAPCHKGRYAMQDPILNKTYPFVCDGFCRMHMFEDSINLDFTKTEELYNAGINEFVFDFSTIDAKYIPEILNKFFMTTANMYTVNKT